MEECPQHPWDRLGCILTYGGDASSSLANYSLLLLSTAAAALLLAATAPFSPRGTLRSLAWQACALLCVCAFQLGLCVVLGCAGVSIVWNAIDGFLIRRLLAPYPGETTDALLSPPLSSPSLPSPPRRRGGAVGAVGFALIAGLAADLYYAFALPPITTLAHVCALLLGLAIGMAYEC